jgi:hypothetical protein
MTRNPLFHYAEIRMSKNLIVNTDLEDQKLQT